MVVKQRWCACVRVQLWSAGFMVCMAFAISICIILFSFSLFLFLVQCFVCTLAYTWRFKLFALICLLFTANTLLYSTILLSTQEITLLSPHTYSYWCAHVGCWFLSDVCIFKRKTVMWLHWIAQMIFDSSSTNTMHCISATKYTIP